MEFLQSFHRSPSTGSVVFFLSPYLYETKFFLIIVLTHKEKINFALELGQNHCPRMQKVYFRLTFVAQKPLCFSSLFRGKTSVSKKLAVFSGHDDVQTVAYIFLFHDLERSKNILLALRAVLSFIKDKSCV